jgi:hypothetical protein
LAIQSDGSPAVCGKEAKESSCRGDLVLQAGSTQALASFIDVGLYILWLNRVDRDLP